MEALLRQLEAERQRLQLALDAAATRVIDFDRMIEETKERIERTRARIEADKSQAPGTDGRNEY